MIEPKETVTVRYRCTLATDCTETVGADCSGCDKITTKTTKRALPKCDGYVKDDGAWIEVYMRTTPMGQRFFFGEKVWVQDPDKELGDLMEIVRLGEAVIPHTNIHGCEDAGTVRFFVARELP